MKSDEKEVIVTPEMAQIGGSLIMRDAVNLEMMDQNLLAEEVYIAMYNLRTTSKKACASYCGDSGDKT